MKPAYDAKVESDLLGAMLLWNQVTDAALADLREDSFYDPFHRRIFSAVRELRESGSSTDAVSVVTQMYPSAGTERNNAANRITAIQADATGSAATATRIRTLLALSTRRQVQHGVQQLAHDADNNSISTEDLVGACRLLGTNLRHGSLSVAPPPGVEEFLAVEDKPFDWVVEGLFERGDRLILTGGEGMGKSTFLRQIAVCLAYGCHPFTQRLIPARRCLIIDCENSGGQLRRALRPLADELRRKGYKLAGELFIEVRSEVLDLKRQSDEQWLYERIQSVQPDVVVIGPLYKLGAVGNDEEPARQVAQVLDTVRARWNPALLMETHSPHGDGYSKSRPLRPIGASYWMRWPEFGYSIQADNDSPAEYATLRPWRGPRELRDWPKELARGGPIPWTLRSHTTRGLNNYQNFQDGEAS